MDLIQHLRLANRALISGDINNLYEVIKLAQKYSVELKVGTAGGSVPGPFIESIYVLPDTRLEVRQFYHFIRELTAYLDMYNGIRPYSVLELVAKFSSDNGGLTFEDKSQVCVFFDAEAEKFVYMAIDQAEEPIIKVDPRCQFRITMDDVKKLNEQKLLFNAALAGESMS